MNDEIKMNAENDPNTNPDANTNTNPGANPNANPDANTLNPTNETADGTSIEAELRAGTEPGCESEIAPAMTPCGNCAESTDDAKITEDSEDSEFAEDAEDSGAETTKSGHVTDTPSLETLQATLQKYGIEVSAAQTELLEKFCELQWDWNQKINLTRHTTYEKFVTRDLIDTLAFSEFLAPNEKVLDVGSGSGVPGILLGILRPDVSISLVECVAKKAKVLADIIHELQLPIPVYCALGQDILGNWQFHTLTFRAVASMKKILEWFKPSWPHFDRMLLVKGPRWLEERGEARHYSLFHGLALRKLKEYATPGSDDGKLAVEDGEKPLPSENLTETGDGAKSVVLQICPEEKLGKGNLCVLSSLETSKSRNKYDHNRRRKSRVTEETIEYVDAADFDGLDDDGDQIELEKNAPRPRFGSGRRSAFDRSERTERDERDRGNRGNRGDRGGDRTDRSERRSFGARRSEDGERRGFGARRSEDGERRGFGARRSEEGERRGFGARRSEDGERRGFGARRSEDGERRGFGARRSEDGERRGFGARRSEDGERRGFGARRSEDGERRGFGGGSRRFGSRRPEGEHSEREDHSTGHDPAFGGRSGGLDSGFGERKRFHGPRNFSCKPGGNRKPRRDGE